VVDVFEKLVQNIWPKISGDLNPG